MHCIHLAQLCSETYDCNKSSKIRQNVSVICSSKWMGFQIVMKFIPGPSFFYFNKMTSACSLLRFSAIMSCPMGLMYYFVRAQQ